MKIKALIAGLVAGTILMAQAGMASIVLTPGFSDVSESRADYNAITFLADMDLIGGYDDGTFKPDQVVNRAEALKMIMGMDNFNYWDKAVDGPIFAGASTDMPFTDLDKTAWYYKYLQEAYDNDLVDGYPDGTFKPEHPVGLVEAIKILLNHTFLRIDKLSAEQPAANAFNDTDKTQWYANYVLYAKDVNILVADSKGNIYPSEGVTRGKLAQLIYRAYAFDGQTIDKKGVTVALDEAAGKYIVSNEGKEIARLDKIGDNGEEEAYIKKVTDKYAYVSVCATGFGGYIWYGFCYGNTYRVDLETGIVEQLNFSEPVTSKKIGNFMDVSADETTTAWTSNSEDHKIYMALIASDALADFSVPEKYGQYGDVKFSPDGKKLAYAAIVGEPDNEESAVYIIDIETGEQTLEKEVTKQILSVNGWNTDGTVMYSVVTQN